LRLSSRQPKMVITNFKAVGLGNCYRLAAGALVGAVPPAVDLNVTTSLRQLNQQTVRGLEGRSQGSVGVRSEFRGRAERPLRSAAVGPGEWPGGVSPPGSLRTGRDSLPSSGSHYPTAWD
jgi:hypothetical protein